MFNDIKDIFICCTSVWQSTFVKAEYIIKWWPVQWKINEVYRQFVTPLAYQDPDLMPTQTSKHLLIKNKDTYTYEIKM